MTSTVTIDQVRQKTADARALRIRGANALAIVDMGNTVMDLLMRRLPELTTYYSMLIIDNRADASIWFSRLKLALEYYDHVEKSYTILRKEGESSSLFDAQLLVHEQYLDKFHSVLETFRDAAQGDYMEKEFEKYYKNLLATTPSMR